MHHRKISTSIFLVIISLFITVNILKAQPEWDSATLNTAYNEEMPRWFNNPRDATAEKVIYHVLRTGKALHLLSLNSFYSQQADSISDKVVEMLRFVIEGGHEPSFRTGTLGWADAPLAQSIALAKYNPVVWNQFSAKEKEKLDLVMKAFAFGGNYSLNKENDPKILICDYADYNKAWNPNFSHGYLGAMIAAYIYFGGAEAVNDILMSFDYTKFLEDIQAKGFTTTEACWSYRNELGSLLMNGGKDKEGGTVSGMRIPFTYKSLNGDGSLEYDPFVLYNELNRKMFHWDVTSINCDGDAYIIDQTSSPYEGDFGMLFEFNTGDGSGCRSDALYSTAGWTMDIIAASTIQAFNFWPDSSIRKTLIEPIRIGTEDLKYKLEHGYHSRSNGNLEDMYLSRMHNFGFEYVYDVYKKILMNNESLQASVQGINIQDTIFLKKDIQSPKAMPVFTPVYATNKNVSFSSTDTSILSVDSTGVITSLKDETASVIVTTQDGGFKDTSIVVKQLVQEIIPMVDKYVIESGYSLTPKFKVLPVTAYDPTVVLSSSDETVITVNNGRIEAKGVGNASLIINSSDGAVSNQVAIEVVEDNNLITNLSPSNYQFDYFSKGAAVYNDRSIQMMDYPSYLEGEKYIRTSNIDKSKTIDDYLSFTISEKSWVYIAYDNKAPFLPTAFSDYEALDEQIFTDDLTFGYKLYRKPFQPGEIVLAGNKSDGYSSKTIYNYFVIIVPDNTINVGINALENVDKIVIYPNPVSNFFTIKGMNPDQKSSVAIYNLLGKKMKSYQVQHKNLSIDCSDLTNGNYLVRITSGKNVTNYKLMVRHNN